MRAPLLGCVDAYDLEFAIQAVQTVSNLELLLLDIVKSIIA
jgi:hypothetical protein